MPDNRVYPTVKEIIQERIAKQAALQAKEAALPVTTTKQENTMPNETAQSRANEMMNRLQSAQSTGAFVEALKQSEPVQDKPAQGKQTEATTANNGQDSGRRTVEPKQFSMSHSHMGQIDSFVVNMSLVDLIEYADFEKSLYKTENGSPKSESQLKEMSFLERFQRQLDSSRVSDIAAYLIDSPMHYFPPIVCVPTHGALYDELVRQAKENGGGQASVTLDVGSILAIDGQHRLAGIKKAINETLSGRYSIESTRLEMMRTLPLSTINEETQEKRDKEIAKTERLLAALTEDIQRISAESMPVVIVAISPDNLQAKQQLFSDINKTPRKVSKAIATLYDHIDLATKLAKYSVGLKTDISEDGYTDEGGNSPLAMLINVEGITPKKSESKPSTLTNIASIIQPDKSSKCLVNAVRDGKVDVQEVGLLVKTIVHNLPRIDDLLGGTPYSKVAGKYVCYSSVFWKGMGQCIDNLIAEQNLKKEDVQDYSSVVDTVERLMVNLSESDGWSVDDVLWTTKDRPVVNTAGKIDNKITTVKWMGEILLSEAKRLRDVDAVLKDGQDD